MGPDRLSLAGRVVGGYRLLHELGAGGFGVVYLAQRAYDPAALVAIKLLMLPWSTAPAVRVLFHARFLREAQAAQRLTHPHILPVLSYGEADGLTYMVLPFVEVGTLAAHMAALGKMPLDLAANYLTQLASALDYAHAHHVIHRDIKPTNALLGDEGQLLLADFGIARVLATDDEAGATAPTALTATGDVLGTPHYMAPEQMGGERVGPAADVYALGVVLYQMVTGQLPFQADTPLALAMLHLQAPPPPPRLRRPELPPAAEAAILRALAKRPADRYASAGELARAFAQGVRATTTAPATAAGPEPVTAEATQQPASDMAPPPWGTMGERGARGSLRLLLIGVGVLALAAMLVVGIGLGVSLALRATASGTPSASTRANSQPERATPTLPASILTPAGVATGQGWRLSYQTTAPGMCDQQGGTWAQNDRAEESCTNEALLLSDGKCTCPIGVVTLAALPHASYPTTYVARVTITTANTPQPDAKFGFKFRQQSVSDNVTGRGGYSFLVDPNGQWQFNRYDPAGPRHILVQRELGFRVVGTHILDLVVQGTSYAFYLDGTLITTQQEFTYSGGFFCLAVEPGASIAFHNFQLYTA